MPATLQPKAPPPWLLALGREAPPPRIEVDSGGYRLEKVLKHDFFAFTGLYRGAHDALVLKIGRKASAFGIPLSWVGRLVAWHESGFLRATEDIEIIPRYAGRFGPQGFLHEYVEGHDLERGERVRDDFFDRLRAGLDEIHEREMAIVDLEKIDNILVGDDGRPFVIDFQISYRWPFKRGGDLAPVRWLRLRFQRCDVYHLYKQKKRTRPDQLSAEEVAAAGRRPLVIRIHGKLTRPITRVRRWILNRLDPAGRGDRFRRAERPSSHESPATDASSSLAEVKPGRGT